MENPGGQRGFRNAGRITAIVCVVAFLTFYYIFNPVESGFMPQCVFHRLTSLSCPGCGSQRMLHAVLHGNIRQAFEANAFLTIISPGLLFLIWLETQRRRRSRLYARVYSVWFIYTVTALLLVWFVVRNILGI